jgi:outer membrane protein OmpA-like peptidoglycan-associated protein
MRLPPVVFCFLVCATQATAQVSVDTHALDTLPQASAAAHAPAPSPDAGDTQGPARKTQRKAGPHRSTHAHSAPSAAPTPVAKTLPRVPPAPPAYPVIAPPPLVLPSHPPPPPPPVPVSPKAAGVATDIPDGMRITFGAGDSTLNPATLLAIQTIAAQAAANPAMTVGVTAWAPGRADDPSTPRRLSLDRALAARAVLINAGIASERIRTIAKGMNDIGQAPADRVDVVKIIPPPSKPPAPAH